MVVGLIGSGRLASSIALGWAAGQRPFKRLLITDSGSGSAERLAENVDAERIEGNAELARRADAVLICVKPRHVIDLADEIRDELGPEKLVISALGATSIASLVKYLGPEANLIRIMPNVAGEQREGVSAYSVGLSRSTSR